MNSLILNTLSLKLTLNEETHKTYLEVLICQF